MLFLLPVSVCLMSLFSGATASGAREEVRQGVLYAGGTLLEASAEGVSFVVPGGWQAIWPQGSEFLVMQQPADARVTLLATVQEAGEDEIAATMAAPIELGDGIVLVPRGGVETRGSWLEASYDVTGAQMPLEGRGAARSHGGVALAFVLVAPGEVLDQHLGTFRGLVEGAKLAAPRVAQGSRGDPDGGAAGDGASDRWDVYLKGKYIVRYYTATGYTDETHLWLCSDGSFYRRGAAGGFGGGASGAFDARSSGRWQASGAGANGVLTLRYGDGSVVEHALRWDYGDNRLYLDGKRWLHGENERCQ